MHKIIVNGEKHRHALYSALISQTSLY